MFNLVGKAAKQAASLPRRASSGLLGSKKKKSNAVAVEAKPVAVTVQQSGSSDGENAPADTAVKMDGAAADRISSAPARRWCRAAPQAV